MVPPLHHREDICAVFGSPPETSAPSTPGTCWLASRKVVLLPACYVESGPSVPGGIRWSGAFLFWPTPAALSTCASLVSEATALQAGPLASWQVEGRGLVSRHPRDCPLSPRPDPVRIARGNASIGAPRGGADGPRRFPRAAAPNIRNAAPPAHITLRPLFFTFHLTPGAFLVILEHRADRLFFYSTYGS